MIAEAAERVFEWLAEGEEVIGVRIMEHSKEKEAMEIESVSESAAADPREFGKFVTCYCFLFFYFFLFFGTFNVPVESEIFGEIIFSDSELNRMHVITLSYQKISDWK